MDLERKNFLTETSIRANIRMVDLMERESTSGAMEGGMKDGLSVE